MRVTLIVLVISLLLSCRTRDVQNQKIQENSKIEVNEVIRDDIQEVALSSNEITTSIVEVDTSNLIGLDIDYKGKYGDEIEIIKDVGKLIIKGSGEIDIKAVKEDRNKNKASDVTFVESTSKNSITSYDSEINVIQDVNSDKKVKEVTKNSNSVFCIFGIIMVVAVIYLLIHLGLRTL